MNTDFGIVSSILDLTIDSGEPPKTKEAVFNVKGEPLTVYLEMLVYSWLRFREKYAHDPLNTEITVTAIRLSNCTSSDSDEDTSLSTNFDNICTYMGGLLDYIKTKGLANSNISVCYCDDTDPFRTEKISIFDGTAMMTKQQFVDNYLRNDKKMLENLLKLRIAIKTQTNDEALTDLIKEIKQLVYTERCSEYSKQLKALVEVADNTDSVKGDIAACEMKLQQGVKYNGAKYGTLTKAENAVEESKKSFDLIQIVSVLTEIEKPEVDTEIEEYSEFLFSPTYVARVERILTEATKILDENFLAFVAKLRCAYSQSSEFLPLYSMTEFSINV